MCEDHVPNYYYDHSISLLKDEVGDLEDKVEELESKIKGLKSENNKLEKQVKDLKWMNKRLTEINNEYRSREQIWFTGEENNIGEHEITCEQDCGGDCNNCENAVGDLE